MVLEEQALKHNRMDTPLDHHVKGSSSDMPRGATKIAKRAQALDQSVAL